MRRKIIIVDDDPVILELVQINLKFRGYDVTPVQNGNEALDKIAEIMPDLIVLDVMMPDIDGWEILKVIKDFYADSNMKVIMLTAKSSEKDKMIGRSILKADEYITKPFNIEDLLKSVRKHLGE